MHDLRMSTAVDLAITSLFRPLEKYDNDDDDDDDDDELLMDQ